MERAQSSSNKSARLRWKIVLGAGVILGLVYAFFQIRSDYRARQRGLSHARIKSIVSLRAIESAIDMYVIVHKSLPGLSGAGVDSFSSSNMVRQLAADSNGIQFLEQFDSRTFDVKDPWHSPIQIRLVELRRNGETNTARLKLWSFGPNKQNEEGKGDDIGQDVVVFW